MVKISIVNTLLPMLLLTIIVCSNAYMTSAKKKETDIEYNMLQWQLTCLEISYPHHWSYSTRSFIIKNCSVTYDPASKVHGRSHNQVE